MKFERRYKLPDGEEVEVRLATVADSWQTAAIWNSIVKEKKFTMGLNLISEEEEKEFIRNLDKQEAILVAILRGKVVGYLILLIPDKICKSTLHVVEIGTFVLKKYRGLRIGNFLLLAGFEFAKNNDFEKMVIKVRSSNKNALSFYKKHGFKEVGRLKRQVKIDGKYDDHILMERFLSD